MARLSDKTIIVTGGARGLGQAFCVYLAKEGATVVCADILDTDETKSLVERVGGKCISVKVDVTDLQSVQAMAKKAMEETGRIDGLLNNAALYGGLQVTPFDQIDDGEWDRVMRINVKGVWYCCKAAVPYMIEGGGGSIVNISSSTVLAGAAFLSHYVASKGAVLAFTRSLSNELGDHGICVNVITPGYTLTEASLGIPGDVGEFVDIAVPNRAIKRSMMPDDLVGIAAFLFSDESCFITGQTFNVDGGAIDH